MFDSCQLYPYPLSSVDFDEDDLISSRDLKEVIDRLTGEQQLSNEDMNQLIDNVSKINPSNAEAAFVQSTKTQCFLKTI